MRRNYHGGMPDTISSGPRQNLLGTPETRLAEDFIDVEIADRLDDGAEPSDLAREHPESPLVWGTLAQDALAEGEEITAYACARTGYHRGLDALRRAGWRGHGRIPASHRPNRGFLLALVMLGETSRRLGDQAEVDRVQEFLAEADPTLLG